MTSPRPPATHQYRSVIKAGRWFAGLPETLQAALLGAAVVRQLAPGERLFSRGDAFDGIYCVAEGALRVGASNEAGKEALLTVVEPGNWFGEIALIDGLARTHDASAEGNCMVLRVPPAALDKILQESPESWRWFALLLTHKMRFAFVGIEEAALLPAPLRVARRLVQIAEGYGEFTDRSRRLLTLPQEQLASMLSLSRQTINQVLKQFEAQGLIRLHYRELEILDWEGLRRAGEAT